ncbi:MAG: TetR/AcrR family transcriptional regulator [Epsilonproteobacteria bacterium]|nr:TetR/AcrR family transcriptional regulator [Campylobacterota bacterium]
MQNTRENILDAVFKLVYINGFHGTSMSMILKECGIAKGSLYHHFKSKKEMVLAVINERILPRMVEFYKFEKVKDEHPLDTIITNILHISSKDELILYGCPLHRLNQEMSPLDEDFEREINKIYKKMKTRIFNLLVYAKLTKEIDIDSLSEYIIATVWGALSLSPEQSSKKRYLSTTSHLTNYLHSLK